MTEPPPTGTSDRPTAESCHSDLPPLLRSGSFSALGRVDSCVSQITRTSYQAVIADTLVVSRGARGIEGCERLSKWGKDWTRTF